MKHFLALLLLANFSLGCISESESPDSAQDSRNVDQQSDVEPHQQQGKTVRNAPARELYQDDLMIRMVACEFILVMFDVNAITGEAISLAKWACPKGFR
jgi:hypothetical protein